MFVTLLRGNFESGMFSKKLGYASRYFARESEVGWGVLLSNLNCNRVNGCK